MKTVTEVSKITGISVRTLHYYDEIGLLKPTDLSEAGYRLYDDKALETLQQLFFKEFDMCLKDIKAIMLNPNFDKNKTLMDQKKLLLIKRSRLDGLIGLIDDILKGDNSMSFQEFSRDEIEDMFAAMMSNMGEEQVKVIADKYGDIEKYKEEFVANAGSEHAQGNYKKVIEWYGSKEAAMETVNNPNSSEIMESYQNRISGIYKKLSLLQKEDINSFEIKKLIGEYDFVSKQLYQMKDVKPLLLELAKEYMENNDLIRANDEQFGSGSSVFIGKAIINFYHK
ncbi:MerR family DNA-binding transcriptional regulator [Anaerocolumna sp. AGMB13025]|uniref:MerR family transcriptional regulator n=1 Tax=Anaerocolumna sp. AGMB13025 TaxID=3039116 RepID=UPI00241F72AB|nr:MerR family transcriptional regulator [Anaerocolumna sp. AGMB13025]WFR58863.1 MerR family DNA-binding transcriptional regulator [Anaerocolumna sp. AGMB13025]